MNHYRKWLKKFPIVSGYLLGRERNDQPFFLYRPVTIQATGKQKRSSESTYTLAGYIKLHFTRLWLVEDNDWHFIGHLDWVTTVISKGKDMDALFYQIHTYAFSFPMNILLG